MGEKRSEDQLIPKLAQELLHCLRAWLTRQEDEDLARASLRRPLARGDERELGLTEPMLKSRPDWLERRRPAEKERQASCRRLPGEGS
jgi:hypothetical protein